MAWSVVAIALLCLVSVLLIHSYLDTASIRTWTYPCEHLLDDHDDPCWEYALWNTFGMFD